MLVLVGGWISRPDGGRRRRRRCWQRRRVSTAAVAAAAARGRGSVMRLVMWLVGLLLATVHRLVLVTVCDTGWVMRMRVLVKMLLVAIGVVLARRQRMWRHRRRLVCCCRWWSACSRRVVAQRWRWRHEWRLVRVRVRVLVVVVVWRWRRIGRRTGLRRWRTRRRRRQGLMLMVIRRVIGNNRHGDVLGRRLPCLRRWWRWWRCSSSMRSSRSLS